MGRVAQSVARLKIQSGILQTKSLSRSRYFALEIKLTLLLVDEMALPLGKIISRIVTIDT